MHQHQRRVAATYRAPHAAARTWKVRSVTRVCVGWSTATPTRGHTWWPQAKLSDRPTPCAMPRGTFTGSPHFSAPGPATARPRRDSIMVTAAEPFSGVLGPSIRRNARVKGQNCEGVLHLESGALAGPSPHLGVNSKTLRSAPQTAATAVLPVAAGNPKARLLHTNGLLMPICETCVHGVCAHSACQREQGS